MSETHFSLSFDFSSSLMVFDFLSASSSASFITFPQVASGLGVQPKRNAAASVPAAIVESLETVDRIVLPVVLGKARWWHEQQRRDRPQPPAPKFCVQ